MQKHVCASQEKDLPSTIQFKGSQKACTTAESREVVNAATGHVAKSAYRRRKRFRTAPNPPNKPLLTEDEAAYVLDLEPESLAVFRSTGRHQIPFIKIGRNVRYRRLDLETWLISRTHALGMTNREQS